MRAFAACRIDPSAAAELDLALAPLHAVSLDKHFRRVAAGNYHLTLRFFGDMSAEAAADAGRLIGAIARTESPFECRATQPVALPNRRRPNVVALPIESNGRLERLAAACNEAFTERFGDPDKPFRAHLTVLRCRPGARFREVADTIEFPFVVSSVGLYESTQVAGSVRYTALYEFEFGRAAVPRIYVS